MKQRWIIFVAISLAWGSEWILNFALIDVPRFRLLSIRYLLAALTLLPWSLKKITTPAPILRNLLLSSVVIVLPALFLGNRPNLSPGIVVLLFATLPLIASVLESDSGLTRAPLLLGGLAGIAFLVRGGLSFALSQSLAFLGLLLILTLSACVLVRTKAWPAATNLAQAVMLQMLTAGLVFGAFSLFTEKGSTVDWTRNEVTAIAVLGILSSTGYYGFYRLLARNRVSQVAAMQWIIPAISFAETTLWLRHLPTWDAAAGGLACIACAILFFQDSGSNDTLTLQITTTPNL